MPLSIRLASPGRLLSRTFGLTKLRVRGSCVSILALALFYSSGAAVAAGPSLGGYWQVDDVRAGMKGTGRTVMKGTKIETFDAEVLGVLKNTSPGRDMVLCRLSGLDLEKTGVIAGMSGSPIYIDNKLLGAVAYAWPYGKEPIAGVTPFVQMHGFVASYERRDLAERAQASRIGLARPLRIDGQSFDTVTVTQDFDDPEPAAADGLWMTAAAHAAGRHGLPPRSLALLRRSARQVRHGADAGRGRAAPRKSRGGRQHAARAGRATVVSP